LTPISPNAWASIKYFVTSLTNSFANSEYDVNRHQDAWLPLASWLAVDAFALVKLFKVARLAQRRFNQKTFANKEHVL